MKNITEIMNVSVETSGDSKKFPRENFLESDPFISDEARRVMEILFYAVLCFTISIVGLAANIINIIIFRKQGFNDSVNIGLCSLSVYYLCFLLTLTWMSICYNPLFKNSDLEFDSLQFQYITAGWPIACFTRITSWITALITFERCVCIALPMKVKDIITPKRTFITVVVIAIAMIASVTPVFCSVHFTTSYNIERNKTLLGIRYSNNGDAFGNVTFSINVCSQFCSCIIVLVCTVILIYNLRVKSQWRKEASAVSPLVKSNVISSRDKRVIKMVTSIACIFIVCYLPGTLNMILIIQYRQDYSPHGRFHNLYNVSWAIVGTFEAVNSSINILVYYSMSSKFRICFKKIFSNKELDLH